MFDHLILYFCAFLIIKNESATAFLWAYLFTDILFWQKHECRNMICLISVIPLHCIDLVASLVSSTSTMGFCHNVSFSSSHKDMWLIRWIFCSVHSPEQHSPRHKLCGRRAENQSLLTNGLSLCFAKLPVTTESRKVMLPRVPHAGHQKCMGGICLESNLLLTELHAMTVKSPSSHLST